MFYLYCWVTYSLKSTNFSMQKRWKLDQYLSYLSAPPLLCCCSSLWSPERWRQATRNGWTHRKKRGESQTGSLECGWGELWSDILLIRTHRQPDRQTGWTDGSLPGAQTSQDARIRAGSCDCVKVIVSPRKSRKIPNRKKTECVQQKSSNLVLNRPIYAMVSNVYNKNHDPCSVLLLLG